MPAKSKSQQRLMAAAEHGAQFPAAQQIRESMSLGQMRDFARGPTAGKPEHVKKAGGHPNRLRNLKHFAHPKKGKK